jgi:hypothetical protein
MTPPSKSLPIATIVVIIFLFACKTPKIYFDLHEMKDLNIEAGNAFVNYIRQMPNLDAISVIDRKNNGNDFFVNNQGIFLDTIQQDLPNYYSYKKRTGEIHIAADSLFNSIKLFDKIGVNRYDKEEGYYRFHVIPGLGINRGYIYVNSIPVKMGDTLLASSSMNRSYHYEIIINRQLDQHWFEYYDNPNIKD